MTVRVGTVFILVDNGREAVNGVDDFAVTAKLRRIGQRPWGHLT